MKKFIDYRFKNISRVFLLAAALMILFGASWGYSRERPDSEDSGEKAPAKPAAIKKDRIRPVPKIILLTTTEACKCTLERCAAGEKLFKEFFKKFSGKAAFEKFDYAKERNAVESMNRKYKISGLPALLFFDGQGKFTGKLQFFLNEGDILDNLKKAGIK